MAGRAGGSPPRPLGAVALVHLEGVPVMCIAREPLPVAVPGFTSAIGDARDPPTRPPSSSPGVGLPSELVRAVPARDAGAGTGLRPE